MRSARIAGLLGPLTAAIILCAATTAEANDTLNSPALHAVATTDTNLITPTTRRLTGHIELTAGPHSIAVTLEATSPSFMQSVFGKDRPMGATLRPVRLRTTNGFSRFLMVGTGSTNFGGCSFAVVGPQFEQGGNGSESEDRSFVLKPHQRLAFDATYDVAGDAPWYGSNYAPVFRLSKVIRGFDDGTRIRPKGVRTLSRTVTLRPAAPAVAGPFAARIDIASTHAPTKSAAASITGNLTPGAAGRTISFSTIELNNPFKSTPNLVPVGSAVTGNDGSFEFTGWTPPKSKTGYLLFPQYKAQPGDLLPSTMCPIYYSPRNGFLAGFY